jgi:hypothetical protein
MNLGGLQVDLHKTLQHKSFIFRYLKNILGGYKDIGLLNDT